MARLVSACGATSLPSTIQRAATIAMPMTNCSVSDFSRGGFMIRIVRIYFRGVRPRGALLLGVARLLRANIAMQRVRRKKISEPNGGEEFSLQSAFV